MNTFRLIISTPDGNFYDAEAVCLSVRGIDGDLAVMAGHVPFITSIKPCDCHIETKDGVSKIGHLNSGLLAVTAESVTLMSSNFCWQQQS